MQDSRQCVILLRKLRAGPLKVHYFWEGHNLGLTKFLFKILFLFLCFFFLKSSPVTSVFLLPDGKEEELCPCFADGNAEALRAWSDLPDTTPWVRHSGDHNSGLFFLRIELTNHVFFWIKKFWSRGQSVSISAWSTAASAFMALWSLHPILGLLLRTVETTSVLRLWRGWLGWRTTGWRGHMACNWQKATGCQGRQQLSQGRAWWLPSFRKPQVFLSNSVNSVVNSRG